MKRNFIYYAYFVLVLCGVLYSCSKDENTRPQPISNLKAFSGNQRAMVVFDVPRNAQSGKVFYGKGDFVEFKINDPDKEQEILVEGLSEGEQILRVITYGADMISSDPRGVKVTIYGQSYGEGIVPRKLDSIEFISASSEVLSFAEAASDEVGTWIVFHNLNGGKDSVYLSDSARTASIDGYDKDMPFFYYSVYKPVPDAIDEYRTKTTDLNKASLMPMDKNIWEVVDISDEQAGFEGSNLIDNDLHSDWHSDPSAGFSHWFVVDMKKETLIGGFYFLNSQTNGRGIKGIKIEVSTDMTSWQPVVETDVEDNFMRQKLELETDTPVVAKFFKVTILNSWQPTDQVKFAEIDAYNDLTVSGENGYDDYPNEQAIAIPNSTAPFIGDGSNPFPTLGAYRLQKLVDWQTSANVITNYDNSTQSFTVFSAAVWGLPQLSNGKIYQEFTLDPGQYKLTIDVGDGADGFVDAFAVVSSSDVLEDVSAISSSANVLKYVDLMAHQSESVSLFFNVSDAMNIKIGFVLNIRSQYSANGTPWTTFKINGLELNKLVD